jgi:selenocysteine lyase/cysteine desulfurase
MSELDLIQSSGEENVVGIAALGKALLLLQLIGLDLIREEEQVLTRQTLKGLSQIPGMTIYGIINPESPGFPQKGGVVVFSMKGMLAPRIAKELAQKGGIGVRSGCHCAHILVKHLVGVPPAFERFQRLIAKLFPELRFPGLVRVSFGIENSKKDVDTFIQVLGKIFHRTRTLQHTDIKQQMNDFIIAAAKRVYTPL